MQISSTNDISINQVILQSRKPNPRIEEYLSESLFELRSLDYKIEASICEEALFETLNGDLPGSSHNIGRQELIKDMIELYKIFFTLKKTETLRFQLEIVKTYLF